MQGCVSRVKSLKGGKGSKKTISIDIYESRQKFLENNYVTNVHEAFTLSYRYTLSTGLYKLGLSPEAKTRGSCVNTIESLSLIIDQ